MESEFTTKVNSKTNVKSPTIRSPVVKSPTIEQQISKQTPTISTSTSIIIILS